MGIFKKDLESKLELSAVITRADGTVENLGVIAKTKTEGLLKKLFNLIRKL